MGRAYYVWHKIVYIFEKPKNNKSILAEKPPKTTARRFLEQSEWAFKLAPQKNFAYFGSFAKISFST